MKTFALALIAGLAYAQEDFNVEDVQDMIDNADEGMLISPAPEMPEMPVEPPMEALRGEELDAHVRERHQRLDMAREMVEMFCQHRPESEPYSHEVHEEHDHDHDMPEPMPEPADGGRRLQDEAMPVTTMENGDHADHEHDHDEKMEGPEDEATRLARMDKLHKLMDAGEEVAGVENHFLCHQALDIYQQLIEGLHEGELMMHHEEDLERLQGAEGEAEDAIAAVVESIAELFIESDAATMTTASVTAAAIVAATLF